MNNTNTFTIQGWHGGWGDFKTIDPKFFGTGENDALGLGFHITNNELYARNMAKSFLTYFRPKALEAAKVEKFTRVYLHKVEVTVSESNFWDMENDYNKISLHGNRLSEYSGLNDLDKEEALSFLKKNTVYAFQKHEEEYGGGTTTVIVEPSTVKITETYEYFDDPNLYENDFKLKYSQL